MSNNSNSNYFIIFDNKPVEKAETCSCINEEKTYKEEEPSRNICGYNTENKIDYHENHCNCNYDKEEYHHKNTCDYTDKSEIKSYEEYCKYCEDIDIKSHKNNCSCYSKKEDSYEDYFRKCKCDYESSKNHKE